jgi:cytochrome c biogenesis protein CcmG, thiol:disulfide interchange protein DsbE
MKRPLVLFAIAISPVVALVALLAWGQVQTGGVPGGVTVFDDGGEVRINLRQAPSFELQLLDGGALRLENLRGQVVMVDFWASWCPPCHQEAPTLARVYREYEDKRVEFVGISVWDDEDDARSYVERYGFTFPTAVAQHGATAIEYGVRGIPEKYFIDRDGVIVRKFIGPTSEDRLREVLDEMLAENHVREASRP